MRIIYKITILLLLFVLGACTLNNEIKNKTKIESNRKNNIETNKGKIENVPIDVIEANKGKIENVPIDAIEANKGKIEDGKIDNLNTNAEDGRLFGIILKKKKWSLCYMLKDKSFRDNCIDRYYYDNAINLGKVDLCKKIQEEGIRKDCILYAKGSKKILEIERKYDDVIKNKEWEKCKDFEEPLKSNCINESYYDKAVKEKNKAICDKINDKEFRKFCKRKIK